MEDTKGLRERLEQTQGRVRELERLASRSAGALARVESDRRRLQARLQRTEAERELLRHQLSEEGATSCRCRRPF